MAYCPAHFSNIHYIFLILSFSTTILCLTYIATLCAIIKISADRQQNIIYNISNKYIPQFERIWSSGTFFNTKGASEIMVLTFSFKAGRLRSITSLTFIIVLLRCTGSDYKRPEIAFHSLSHLWRGCGLWKQIWIPLKPDEIMPMKANPLRTH